MALDGLERISEQRGRTSHILEIAQNPSLAPETLDSPRQYRDSRGWCNLDHLCREREKAFVGAFLGLWMTSLSICLEWVGSDANGKGGLRLGGLQESGDSIRMSVAACLMQVGHRDFRVMYVMNYLQIHIIILYHIVISHDSCDLISKWKYRWLNTLIYIWFIIGKMTIKHGIWGTLFRDKPNPWLYDAIWLFCCGQGMVGIFSRQAAVQAYRGGSKRLIDSGRLQQVPPVIIHIFGDFPW